MPHIWIPNPEVGPTERLHMPWKWLALYHITCKKSYIYVSSVLRVWGHFTHMGRGNLVWQGRVGQDRVEWGNVVMPL